MIKSKFKIVDWHVHTGNQYEFAKTGHDFYLIGKNGEKPSWNPNDRPLPENITLLTEEEALDLNFDIAICRTPIPSQRYLQFIRKGAIGLTPIQTNSPITLPKYIKHVVWNSQEARRKHLGFYRGRHEHYIVHGIDPEEFKPLNLEQNQKVLTVANHFKGRSEIMGFPLWESIRNKLGIELLDVVGSANEDIPNSIAHSNNFQQLIEYYNSYSVYFNPTMQSAMPRSRAEAMMCGKMPIVTTNNYDIGKYITHGKDGYLVTKKGEAIKYIQLLLENKELAAEIAENGRKTAIKHFHIKDNIEKWNEIFRKM